MVPYAKPSIQFADDVVEKALELVSKPTTVVQGAVSLVGEKATDCKAEVVAKASFARGAASQRVTEGKAFVVDTLQKCQSFAVEAKSAAVEALKQRKLLAAKKIGQVTSWSSSKLQTLVARLHLVELKEMAFSKGKAGKEYVTTVVEVMPGKAYSCAAHVAGKNRVDHPLDVVAKHAKWSPMTQDDVKKSDTSSCKTELDKKRNKDDLSDAKLA